MKRGDKDVARQEAKPPRIEVQKLCLSLCSLLSGFFWFDFYGFGQRKFKKAWKKTERRLKEANKDFKRSKWSYSKKLLDFQNQRSFWEANKDFFSKKEAFEKKESFEKKIKLPGILSIWMSEMPIWRANVINEIWLILNYSKVVWDIFLKFSPFVHHMFVLIWWKIFCPCSMGLPCPFEVWEIFGWKFKF